MTNKSESSPASEVPAQFTVAQLAEGCFRIERDDDGELKFVPFDPELVRLPGQEVGFTELMGIVSIGVALFGHWRLDLLGVWVGLSGAVTTVMMLVCDILDRTRGTGHGFPAWNIRGLRRRPGYNSAWSSRARAVIAGIGAVGTVTMYLGLSPLLIIYGPYRLVANVVRQSARRRAVAAAAVTPTARFHLYDGGYVRMLVITSKATSRRARESYLDEVDSALHESPHEEQDDLVRDFIVHLPASIAASWWADMRNWRDSDDR